MSFENIFDEALYGADSAILDTMGITVHIEMLGKIVPVTAVFDAPADDFSLPNQAGNFQDVEPTLFVRTAFVQVVQKKAHVIVHGKDYWVVKVGPDDGGSCVITLARGKPGETAPEPAERRWSEDHVNQGIEVASRSPVRYRRGRNG